MNPIQSIKTCIIKTFRFSGRASRSEFWWFVGFYVLFYFFVMQFEGEHSMPNIGALPKIVLMLLLIVLTVVIMVAFVSVGARRLHDMNLSGWWQAIFYAIAWGKELTAPHTGIHDMLSFLATLTIWMLILKWAKKGSDTPNKYGVSPLSEKT